jgi:hypothetical protein
MLFLQPLIPQETVASYLRGLAETDRSLSRQLNEILNLIPQYGPDAVATALPAQKRPVPSDPIT